MANGEDETPQPWWKPKSLASSVKQALGGPEKPPVSTQPGAAQTEDAQFQEMVRQNRPLAPRKRLLEKGAKGE